MKLYLFMGLAAIALAAAASGGEKASEREPTAQELFRDAQKAEKAGQTVQAYLLYAEAAAKDPTNPNYWIRAQALRPAAVMAKPEIGNVLQTTPDQESPKSSGRSEIDPEVVGKASEWDMVEAKRHPLPPAELKATPGPKDFDLKGDAKSLFEKVAAAFGLLVVFDDGYQPAQSIHFEISQVDYRDALRALEDATNSFVVPAGDRLILIANDTQQKRQQLESTAAVVIPIPDPFTVQEVQEIATGVRGVLDIQRLMVDTQLRQIVIRDRAWKVRAAQTLIYDLLQPRPQVAIEIDIISADRSKSKTWGIDLPTQFPLVSFGPLLHTLPKYVNTSIPAGFSRFLLFGGGASFMGLGLTSATLFATATDANITNVLKSEVVTSDGVATTFDVGQKYPLVTSTYAFSSQQSGSFVPPPQFNFEDLGLLLKITPHVHGLDEMSLELSAEFKLLGASSIDNIPVIAQRKFESKIRLRNGEWAVVAGLVSKSELKTITGIPGLMFIPFLRKNTTQDDRSDVMILLKPHLLNLPPTEARTHPEWIGTETRGRNL